MLVAFATRDRKLNRKLAKAHKYKEAKSSILSKQEEPFFAFLDKAKTLFTNKITIMVVPHSQGRVVNFQTNLLAILLGIVVVIAIILSVVYFNNHSAFSSKEVSSLVSENKEMLKNIDEMRDENAALVQVGKKFKDSLTKSLSVLGLNHETQAKNASITNKDLSLLFDVNSLDSVEGRDIFDVQSLTSYLDASIKPIEQVGRMLDNQSSLFKEIPNICPVKSNNLHISMTFGPNVHPISGQWYIHKGVDFSTFRSGDIVMATANGQVVSCGYDNNFGNFVIIRHKHGIYTRFAHLSRFIIKKGDYVTQGQTIGFIGNTGITTGAHLHYEVHVGSDVVDPTKYINIRVTSK